MSFINVSTRTKRKATRRRTPFGHRDNVQFVLALALVFKLFAGFVTDPRPCRFVVVSDKKAIEIKFERVVHHNLACVQQVLRLRQPMAVVKLIRVS